MRILGEEVAGGDMALLDKMFEKGEIETSKYLPIVLSRMKKESDKLMGAYYESLPYATAEASRQREKWMREFAEGGAEKGLLRFWEAWGAFVKESRTWAPQLGEIFGKISWEFSKLFLISNEFKRWAFRGETDIRNFFQQNFGNFDESTFVPLIDAWDNLVKSVLNTVDAIRDAADPDDPDSELTAIQKIFRDFNEYGTNAMNYISWATNRLWGDQELADEAAIPLEAQALAHAEYWRKFGISGNDRDAKAYIRQRSPEIEEGLRYDLESKKALENYLGTVNEESKERQSILESIKKFWNRPPWTQPDGWEYDPKNWKERSDQLIERAKSEYGLSQFYGDGEGNSWFWNPELYPQNIPEQTLNNNSYSQHTHDYKSNITINVSSVGTTEEQAMVISNAITKELGQWEQGMLQKVTVNIPEVTS